MDNSVDRDSRLVDGVNPDDVIVEVTAGPGRDTRGMLW